MGLSLRGESLKGEFPVGKFNIIRIHFETEDSETIVCLSDSLIEIF